MAIRTADLLTVLHQIDNLKGRYCRTCTFWERRKLPNDALTIGGVCTRGHNPAPGGYDGCDEWQSTMPAKGCAQGLK